MIINVDLDTNELIDQPDMIQWEIVRDEKIPIFYEFIKTKDEVTKNELIAEYPNGGKDYREIIISPMEGHFDVTREDGSEFPYSIEIPEGIPISGKVPDVAEITYWHKLTESEQQQRDELERETKEKNAAAQEFIENAPSRIDDIEGGIDDSYDAIAELGIEVAGHAITLDDIMDAIAELGQIVEESNG